MKPFGHPIPQNPQFRVVFWLDAMLVVSVAHQYDPLRSLVVQPTNSSFLYLNGKMHLLSGSGLISDSVEIVRHS